MLNHNIQNSIEKKYWKHNFNLCMEEIKCINMHMGKFEDGIIDTYDYHEIKRIIKNVEIIYNYSTGITELDYKYLIMNVYTFRSMIWLDNTISCLNFENSKYSYFMFPLSISKNKQYKIDKIIASKLIWKYIDKNGEYDIKNKLYTKCN